LYNIGQIDKSYHHFLTEAISTHILKAGIYKYLILPIITAERVNSLLNLLEDFAQLA
jgi:hypothetical protein